MTDCLFCKIVKKEIPSDIVYQDGTVTVREMEPGDEEILGKLFSAAKNTAEELGINNSGYRLIINNGPDANQEVFHLHMHLMGGDKMKHPMG